jgi:hypothetical protein
MELVAWLAGEPWSDSPQCVCPTITAFLRNWNDSLPDDKIRTRLLLPYAPRVVGTRSTDAIAERRAYMALDWLIRTNLPAWLDLTESLRPHARDLRALDEIVDLATASAAGGTVRAAGDAARAARAAWAAKAAAGDAAWTAACAAPSAAPAAEAAVWAAWAAWADGDALQPTTEQLQASACDLLDRMIEEADTK